MKTPASTPRYPRERDITHVPIHIALILCAACSIMTALCLLLWPRTDVNVVADEEHAFVANTMQVVGAVCAPSWKSADFCEGDWSPYLGACCSKATIGVTRTIGDEVHECVQARPEWYVWMRVTPHAYTTTVAITSDATGDAEVVLPTDAAVQDAIVGNRWLP